MSFSQFWYVFLVLLHSFVLISLRWNPFDLSHNFPDLGRRFVAGEQIAQNARILDRVVDDKRDLMLCIISRTVLEQPMIRQRRVQSVCSM
ncbi:hypothetical protein EV421DRAFT_1703241 [Armillaria borealis]|uniref:Uncharacterized protein n=1 Tax=Armillaria borealis TaxID=47425 RepID=A0AA39MZT2_9AGAR|nr:hypothetical protein EV421DRAFT_1703241 [Armillaria borealis]